jgi:hypothetical protein
MPDFFSCQSPWPMAALQFDLEKFEDGGPSNYVVRCSPKDLQMSVQ